MTADDIGTEAWTAGLRLQELTPVQASLEEIFMELTHDAVEYHGAAGIAGAGDPPVLTERIAA